MSAMEEAVQGHIVTMDTAYAKIEQASTKMTDYDKKLRTKLDSNVKIYNESIRRLFKLDGWRDLLFWLGTTGGIVTPIVLIIGHFL